MDGAPPNSYSRVGAAPYSDALGGLWNLKGFPACHMAEFIASFKSRPPGTIATAYDKLGTPKGLYTGAPARRIRRL